MKPACSPFYDGKQTPGGKHTRKYTWMGILLTMMLARGSIAGGQAEILSAQGMGQIGYQAVVLRESQTVRLKHSASSEAVKTPHYRDTFIVTNSWDG